MENPEKKKTNTGALIGAIAAIALCGVTGLCVLLPLAISLYANAWDAAPAWGTLPLCVSILGIVVGVVVPIVLLKKKKPKAEVVPPTGPLPPAS